MALFSLRSAASFRNQSALIYKAAIKAGYEVTERDIIQRAQFPREKWDNTVALVPLWPRYVFDCVRLSAQWLSGRFTLYGPVDGPYLLNITFLQVIKQMRVVTTSKFCKDAMESSDVRVDGIVRHGIDPKDFDFPKVKKYDRLERLRAKYPGRTIFFSNINPLHRKGLGHLAKALKILDQKRPREWVFILHTGKDKALKMAPALAKINGVVIEDAYNQLPFRQIALKTASCDVFVFPSMLEGFGLPILEAMACKRPIVCLDAPAMNELVDDRSAWLFPMSGLKPEEWKLPGCMAHLHDYRPSDLAHAMELSMDNPKESKQKAARAYAESQKYHYWTVYKDLVRGHRK